MNGGWNVRRFFCIPVLYYARFLFSSWNRGNRLIFFMDLSITALFSWYYYTTAWSGMVPKTKL